MSVATPTRSRRSTRRVATVLVIIAVLAALVVAFVRGYLPTGSSAAHPPCEQLPTAEAVHAALDEHAALVEAIEATGPGVTVSRGTPCDDGEDRALVEVTYANDTERDRITDILSTQDGFGVPVYVHGS